MPTIVFSVFVFYSGSALADCVDDGGTCHFWSCNAGYEPMPGECNTLWICCSSSGGSVSPDPAPISGGTSIPGTDITIPDVGLPDPALSDSEGRSGIQIILLNLLNWLLIIFLIASLIAFVITGIMYLMAMGDSRSGLMERAKNYFFYAIMALFITGSGLLIVNIVNEFLTGTL